MSNSALLQECSNPAETYPSGMKISVGFRLIFEIVWGDFTL